MKVLWLVVVGLALLFLAIWAATKDTANQPAKPAVQTTAQLSASAKLAEQAKGDAIARSPSGATIETRSVSPKFFIGSDLQESSATNPGAQAGVVIVLEAKVAGKAVSDLTYHAVPPQTVVFVKQEQLK